MSAHQMLCHLNDSYRVAMGERKVSSATGLFQRTVMKWGGLYVPLPWPKNVATRPEIDQCSGGGTPPSDFERDRRELAALVKRFAAPDRDLAWAPHPIFGSMSEWEWMRWGYVHADHHLRQFGA
jgi:hypothetical protein